MATVARERVNSFKITELEVLARNARVPLIKATLKRLGERFNRADVGEICRTDP